MPDISCPECKKIDPSHAIDRVEKVSAIVAAGTSAGVNSGGLNIGQTALSMALSPPAEPTPPTMRHVSVPPQSTIRSVQLDNGTLMRIFLISCMGGWLPGVVLWVALGADRGNVSAMITAVIAAIITDVILAVILVNRAKRHRLAPATQNYEQFLKVDERIFQEYQAAFVYQKQKKPQYQMALGRWNELYYCYRHDGVFLPDGRSPFMPRHQMRSFCGFP